MNPHINETIANLPPLVLDRTNKTPRVMLDANNLLFEIRGRIMPDTAISFFDPILNWLENYSQNPAQDTLLLLELEYFDTNASQMLLNIFRILEKIQQKGKTVTVNWIIEHGDTDMKEAGEDFAMQLSLHFDIIEL